MFSFYCIFDQINAALMSRRDKSYWPQTTGPPSIMTSCWFDYIRASCRIESECVCVCVWSAVSCVDSVSLSFENILNNSTMRIQQKTIFPTVHKLCFNTFKACIEQYLSDCRYPGCRRRRLLVTLKKVNPFNSCILICQLHLIEEEASVKVIVQKECRRASGPGNTCKIVSPNWARATRANAVRCATPDQTHPSTVHPIMHLTSACWASPERVRKP